MGPLGRRYPPARHAAIPWRALLRRTTNLTASTTAAYVAIPWQRAVYDSDAFWSAGQPTRLTVPAGYALARLHFRGRSLVFNLMLLVQVIPFQLLTIPVGSSM